MPKFKLEEFLLPHEMDKDGKKLDEPGEFDVEKYRKYVYGLLEDKEKAQEARDTAITERDEKVTALKELQQANENDEQRRAREEKEREKEIEDLRKNDEQRRKLDTLAEAFPEATAARIKKLAKRVTGKEDEWVADAKELVEEGFKIVDKPKEEVVVDDDDDTFTSKPVRRSNGAPVVVVDDKKPRSVAEEIDAAGIGRSGW